MHHWVDELSDKEENRDFKAKGLLGFLAYQRVSKCVEDCLDIYNKRHPDRDSDKERLLDKTFQDANQKWIMVGGSPRVGLEFVAGPTFTRIRVDEKRERTERETGEVCLDADETMWLKFDGKCRGIDDVVQETLEPVLFSSVG